jgi:hypothetical protein
MRISSKLLPILAIPASIAIFAAPAHASTVIPSGIEVLSANGQIVGCYQTVGSSIRVEHCNFGLASQRYTFVLSENLGGGTYQGEITQGGKYLDIGPNTTKATVAMSTYSANSILRIYGSHTNSWIERSSRMPATNTGLGSTVVGSTSGNDNVGFNSFDGVQV